MGHRSKIWLDGSNRNKYIYRSDFNVVKELFALRKENIIDEEIIDCCRTFCRNYYDIYVGQSVHWGNYTYNQHQGIIKRIEINEINPQILVQESHTKIMYSFKYEVENEKVYIQWN